MYVRFVSKRGTVASSALDLRDAVTPLTYLVRIATASRREVAAATWPLNPILRGLPCAMRGQRGTGAAQPPSLADRRRSRHIAPAARLPRPAGADRRRQRLPRRRRAQHRRRRPALERRGPALHADGLRPGSRRRARGRLRAASRRRSPGRFEMDHRFDESSERKRVAIMVSREDHCLSDLLWRWRSGELGAELVAVVSNHPDHADQVASLGLPFHHVPVEAGERGGGGAAGAGAARRGRPARPRPLHAGPLRRLPRATSGRRRSTSTTASCPPSSAPTPTSAPTSAASS